MSVTSSTSSPGAQTILIVEDNSAILDLFASVLREAGFTIHTATSVEEALRVGLRQGTNPDLLLTDVLLPNAANLQLKRGPTYGRGVTGLDLYRQLIEKRPGLRVLFMSGQTDEQLRTLGLSRDRYTLLRKPLMPETLVKAVQAAFEHPQPA